MWHFPNCTLKENNFALVADDLFNDAEHC